MSRHSQRSHPVAVSLQIGFYQNHVADGPPTKHGNLSCNEHISRGHQTKSVISSHSHSYWHKITTVPDSSPNIPTYIIWSNHSSQASLAAQWHWRVVMHGQWPCHVQVTATFEWCWRWQPGSLCSREHLHILLAAWVLVLGAVVRGPHGLTHKQAHGLHRALCIKTILEVWLRYRCTTCSCKP